MPSSVSVSTVMHPAAVAAASASTAVHLNIDGATESAAALVRREGAVSSSSMAGAIAVGLTRGN